MRTAFFSTLVLLGISMSQKTSAQTQGFFLDDWTARNIATPDYIDVAKPTTSPTVFITVEANNVLTKIPKYVFGNNCNPYMTQMVTETALINHIKELSPKLIRMPGGNISNVYFWNTLPGAKPADAPDTLLDSDGKKFFEAYWHGKNTSGWTLSLDNYYNMLQQTNSSGIICVNYSYARYGLSNDPVAAAAHLAADWVRYDNGKTKFWEVGNENNGVWQSGYRIDVAKNKDGQPEIITGDLYGKHFKVFVDSMKKAAAEIGKTIYIGAQLLERAPEAWQTATDKSWNQGVFAQAGAKADFYIIHSYYTPYNTNSNATEILNSATTVTRDMIAYVVQNATTNGAVVKPVALTEYNIFAVGSKQAVSHINGMHAAIVTGELIKEKYGQATRWDLANGWDNGNDHGTFSQGDEPGTSKWSPRPSFYHMYYFQKFLGDQMVKSTVSGSIDILSYASTFTSGQVGNVIINKGTTAQTAKVYFQNFIPGTRYYWYTLTGDNDNGEFSRKVLVNGNGPSGESGGPSNYTTLKPNSASANFEVVLTIPPRSATYLLVDKNNTVTAVDDIDPSDKLVQLLGNPSSDGSFTIKFNGFTAADKIDFNVLNVLGQQLLQQKVNGPTQVPVNLHLNAGVYFVQVKTAKGTTTKKLFVSQAKK